MDFLSLRSKHPSLTFERFTMHVVNNQTEVTYTFTLAPNITFSPRLFFPFVLDKNAHAYLFHIGLVELLSYWKLACPKIIQINAGFLDAQQIHFFDVLLRKGLGEFFYTNGIDPQIPDLVEWKVDAQAPHYARLKIEHDNQGQVILVGGGKDSAVALHIIGQSGTSIVMLNPTAAAEAIVKESTITNVLRINRFIDPQLLQLNQQGYLNGHTPFSALLAFVGLVSAHATKKKYVIVANEQSANEGNLVYKGTTINHQYSKSYPFEHDFRQYVESYLSGSANYLSILRPLNELQVAYLFSKLSKYHQLFISCNRNKGASWCGKCPKCAFVFILMSAFLNPIDVEKIFGTNMFASATLFPIFSALMGAGEHKPFECVGTELESRQAVILSRQQYLESNTPIPPMLDQLFELTSLSEREIQLIRHTLLESFNQQHFVPKVWESKIKSALKNST